MSPYWDTPLYTRKQIWTQFGISTGLTVVGIYFAGKYFAKRYVCRKACPVHPLGKAAPTCSFKELRAEAESQGWRVEKTHGGHWRFLPADRGARIVVTSGTPSDYRAVNKMAADLKKSGLRTKCR